MATLTDTPLSVVAVQMHEFFGELTAAGFTDEQAIAIVVGMAKHGER